MARKLLVDWTLEEYEKNRVQIPSSETTYQGDVLGGGMLGVSIAAFDALYY
jgi:hypothetical protein